MLTLHFDELTGEVRSANVGVPSLLARNTRADGLAELRSVVSDSFLSRRAESMSHNLVRDGLSENKAHCVYRLHMFLMQLAMILALNNLEKGKTESSSPLISVRILKMP